MQEITAISAEYFGRIAAELELMAADHNNLPMEREYFRERAEFNRHLQREILAANASAARPYPLANVLPPDRPVCRPPNWVWIFVVAVGTAFALLLWL